MKTPQTPLEHHAVELRLNQEDAVPIQPAKAPVATADKVLLGVGCCLLTAGSAALNVWMAVPTLIISGAAAALLVRHLNVANAMQGRQLLPAEIEVRAAAVQRMTQEERERFEDSKSDAGSDPMYRTSPSNIFYDDYHRS